MGINRGGLRFCIEENQNFWFCLVTVPLNSTVTGRCNSLAIKAREYPLLKEVTAVVTTT